MRQIKEKGFVGVAFIVVVTLALVGGVMWWRLNQSAQHQASSPKPQAESDPNAGYTVIREWGVRFKAVSGLQGVIYAKSAAAVVDGITFTTSTLAAQEPSCRLDSGQIILGLLTRATQLSDSAGGQIAHIGQYYYQYRGPQAACSKGDTSTENTAVLLLKQSLKTLEAAK